MVYEFSDVQLDVAFTKASSKAELTNLDNIATIVGKIAKWYDLYAWSAWTAPTVEVTGSGNAVTSASYGTGANANKLTLTLGSTFLTQHPVIPVTTDTTSTASPAFGGTFTAVDSVSRDANGHVTTLNTKTVTIPNTTMGAATSSTAGSIGLVPAPAAGKQTSFLRGDGTWAIPTNTAYTAGTGLVLSGLTFNHSNSVTAVTTESLLKFAYDAQGHITGSSAATSSDLPSHTHYEGDVLMNKDDTFRTSEGIPIISAPFINTYRADKFAFMTSDNIQIEYTTDGGTTWNDGGYTAADKASLFIMRQAGAIKVGPNTSDNRTTQMQTRITLTFTDRDAFICKLYIWFNTKGHQTRLDIEYANASDPSTFIMDKENALIDGWSGGNVVNISNLRLKTTVSKIRLTFRTTAVNTSATYINKPSEIHDIQAFGKNGLFAAANSMMGYDHLYSWDVDKNAIFPAEIKVPTQLRVYNGNYGALFRNDGTNTWILLTNSGEAESGSWSTLRPFSINNSTGLVAMSEGLKINTKSTSFLELHGGTTATKEYGCVNPKIRFTNADSSQNAELIWDDYDTYCSPASLTLIGNQDGTYFIAPRIRLKSSSTTQALLDFNDANDKGAYLRYSTSTRGYGNIIAMLPYDVNGIGVVFNHTGGGYCCIGAGESPSNFTTAVMSTDKNPYGTTAWSYGLEQMCITSDGSIYFVSGANGLNTTNHTDWTNVKTALFDSDGRFRPSVDNKGQIGASNFKWKAVHSTEVVGNAVGKDGFVSYPEDGTFSGFDQSVPISCITITLPIDTSTITSADDYFKVGFKVDMWGYSAALYTSDTLTIAGVIGNSNSTLGWFAVTALSNCYPFTVSFGVLNSKAQIQIVVPRAAIPLYTPEIRIRDIVVCDDSGNHNTFAENKSGWIIESNNDYPEGYKESGYLLNSSLTSQPGYMLWGDMIYSKAIIDPYGMLYAGKQVGFFHASNATTPKYILDYTTTNTVSAYAYNGTYTIFNIKFQDYARLSFQTTKSGKAHTAPGIVMYPLATSGMTALFSCDGNMVIGGGEFATNAYARKNSSNTTQVGYDNIVTTETEKLYLGADTEVQIISNAGSIATYNNNNHRVWKFQTDGTLLTPGAITDELSAQHTMIQQNLRSDSNAVTLVEWNVNGATSTTYKPGITFHNTGGDSTDKGAIILRPYHHNNAPWGTDVGLYIGKGILKLDGTNVSLEGHTHETLTCKSVDATTVNNTAGCFFFKGVNLLGNINDWVGIQADAGNDKFQLMPNGGGSLMYRQNDTGGTNSSNWSTWNGILTASSVTTDSYLSVAATTTTVGSGTAAFTYNSGVKISHKAYTSKTSGLYKITVDAAGHVSATASVAKGDIPALDYVPNTNAGVNAAINLLTTGSSVPSDADYYISQYANGGTSTTTYHRRPVSALYSYIQNKLQHNIGLNMAHVFSGWNTVGWHRVLSFPCSASASGRIVRTIELTCIRNYNNGQPEVFSVRMIGLYNATEGFEILYSKSNSAATQYIPKIRMTKSSDGNTLYVDFYYNTTNNNGMTVYCTWLDPDITVRGTYNITWGNGAVVDDSLTVVSSLDIPRDITAPGTGFYYVIGTQTASTAAWTGTIPASKLHNGLTIAYYLPYASAASTNVTLNLTLSTGATTGAINCYWNGTTRLTTHYPAGSTIILTYFEAGAIKVSGTATTDARWTHSDYNTNTNTYVTQSISSTTDFRALMLGYNNSTTPSDLTTTVTQQVYASANLYAQPSTGLIGCNGRKLITPFAIQTGSSKRQKITLQTLMNWLMTTKKYIHSGIYEHVVLQTTWSYSDNDILRLAVNGINYEMDLAGVRIEYIGVATSYNAGAFTLKIISNPAPNFTATSGYTKFPPSTIAFYTCNGSSYYPVWRMIMNGACGQPKIFESTDNLSVLPMPIEVTGLFTNWKVLLAQCTRLIYGGGDECSSFQAIIPLEYLKSLGTSGEMHIPLPFTVENNPTGRNYMKLIYVNDNKFTIGYYNSGIDTIGGRGLWTIYGLY